jgi:hypothetical protein
MRDTLHARVLCLSLPAAADRSYMRSARMALLQCLDRMNLQDADRLTVVDFNSSHNAGWWSSECGAADLWGMGVPAGLS